MPVAPYTGYGPLSKIWPSCKTEEWQSKQSFINVLEVDCEITVSTIPLIQPRTSLNIQTTQESIPLYGSNLRDLFLLVSRIRIVPQPIMGAPPALGSCHQYSFVDEVRDVPECRSLRGFGHPCPFGRSEFAFESVPKPIDHFDLPFIHRHFPMALPKFGFAQDSSDCFLRTRQSAAHGLQKPFKPGRYIGGPGRGPF